MSRTILVGSCHCGTVTFELPRKPAVITRCNCSYCRQLDPLFAYFQRRTVAILAKPGNLQHYRWGHDALDWFRCGKCGAFVYHAPANSDDAEARVGMNLRLLPPERLVGTRVRLRDGATGTWSVLSEYLLQAGK